MIRIFSDCLLTSFFAINSKKLLSTLQLSLVDTMGGTILKPVLVIVTLAIFVQLVIKFKNHRFSELFRLLTPVRVVTALDLKILNPKFFGVST